jgi:hypothetical protein
MWIVIGPRSIVPLCGDGMEASITGWTFCPRRVRPALGIACDADLEDGPALPVRPS